MSARTRLSKGHTNSEDHQSQKHVHRQSSVQPSTGSLTGWPPRRSLGRYLRDNQWAMTSTTLSLCWGTWRPGAIIGCSLHQSMCRPIDTLTVRCTLLHPHCTLHLVAAARRYGWVEGIVWTPLPPITWFLPMIGHMGFCDEAVRARCLPPDRRVVAGPHIRLRWLRQL